MASGNFSKQEIIPDIENVFPEENRKRILRQPQAQMSKRSALATLNENIQATKAPKGLSTFSKPTSKTFQTASLKPLTFKPTKTAFTIYEDKPNKENAENFNTEFSTSSISDNSFHLCKFDAQPKSNITVPAVLSPEEEFSEAAEQDSLMVLDTTLEAARDSASANENLFMSSVYSKDIYSYLRELEKKFQPRPTYIRKQPDITQSMRSILVDWLVEVTEEYKMHTETLYLAVSFIDRFLSNMSVLRSKLQLVGTASMFIASKYEEIYPPELREFVYITDDTYTKKQVLRMEHLILKVLAFDLSVPTAYYFLQRVCTVTNVPQTTAFLARYICELSLLEAEPFLSFLPSEIAGSALSLANYTLGYDTWSPELEEATGYQLKDFSTCIQCLYQRYCGASEYPQQAIREKYKSSRYNNVATISPPEQLTF